MKKITLLIAFFVCAIGFSQKTIRADASAKLLKSLEVVTESNLDNSQDAISSIKGNSLLNSSAAARVGDGMPCNQENPFSGAGGGIGSSVDSDFKSASDIVVTTGENFTLNTINANFLTFAPDDPPTTANIVYYDDAGGLPGMMIGSETVVPTILSAQPWLNPVADQYETTMSVTPFIFNGDVASDTTYWIEISMGTATNQATVFWEFSNDTAVIGNAAAQIDASVGTWTIPDPVQEAIYNFSGECTALLGLNDNTLEGFSYYPSPAENTINLSAQGTIENVTVYNMLGQKLIDQNVDAITSELNVSTLTTGAYFMMVSVNGQIGTYKILKK